MSERNNGGPAFPVPGLQHDEAFNGMSLRQYAAIKLRVPDSGTEWLDDMIRQSLRDAMSAKAMQGMLANSQQEYAPLTTKAREDVASEAYDMAGAMLAEREL